MADRPRRSTRLPAKFIEPVAPVVMRPKRKAQDADPDDILRLLLKNPKSMLTSMDISDLINSGSWNMLSPESQTALKALLPPTAFQGFSPYLEEDHISAANSIAIDRPTHGAPSDTLDMSLFTDPHFLAAAHTYQDHIYSDWMSDAHVEKVKKFQVGVVDGTLSAPWKDEAWERNHSVTLSNPNETTAKLSGFIPELSARAGEAAQVRLTTLAQNGVIRVGDVVAYKRTFSILDATVEKDVIIQSIHPKTHAVTILFESGSTKFLPSDLLVPQPSDPPGTTLAMTITSPTGLETELLDVDGRVEKSERPNGNAWKSFTLWRWRGEPGGFTNDGRGGRENHGTLFYLRGSYFHDR